MFDVGGVTILIFVCTCFSFPYLPVCILPQLLLSPHYLHANTLPRGWVEMPRVPRDCRALTRQCGEFGEALTRRWLCNCRGKGVKCRAAFNSFHTLFYTAGPIEARLNILNTSFRAHKLSQQLLFAAA
jgi:hypothetical protein